MPPIDIPSDLTLEVQTFLNWHTAALAAEQDGHEWRYWDDLDDHARSIVLRLAGLLGMTITVEDVEFIIGNEMDLPVTETVQEQVLAENESLAGMLSDA